MRVRRSVAEVRAWAATAVAVWLCGGGVATAEPPPTTPVPERPADAAVAVEADGFVFVEAEDRYHQRDDGPRRWYAFEPDAEGAAAAEGGQVPPGPDADPPHTDGASGGTYLELLPDTRQTHADPLEHGVSFTNAPMGVGTLSYAVRFTSPGRYYVWVRAYSTGSEDNGLHVGLNGAWPESGQRMQWCTGKHAWTWESKQRTDKNHCGEPRLIYLDVDEPGEHTVQFCMREDGFEFDAFVLTQTYAHPAVTNPPAGEGP